MSQDTPMTPYIRLPVFTDLAIRDYRNLQQSTAICHILPYSTIFCLPVFTAISAISAISTMSITSTELYSNGTSLVTVRMYR